MVMIKEFKGLKMIGLLFLLSLLPAGIALAQDAEFTAKASSSSVTTSEPFQLLFSINNASNVSGFAPPAFTGFTVLSQSQSNSMSIVNGHVSRSIGFVYILQANAPGRYTIAAASARINGDKKKSNPVTIEVSKGSAGSTGTNNNGSRTNPSGGNAFRPPVPLPSDESDRSESAGILKKGEDAREKISKNVFVKVDVDKTNVYTGEQLTATYKLYTRMPTSSKVTKVPAFSGFSAHDIELSNPPQATMERINGVAYKVFTIRKTMLFPLQSGDLTLDPVEVDNTVRLYQVNRNRSNRSGDPFDDVFRDAFGQDPFDDPFFDNAFGGGNVTYHDYDYIAKSKPVTIHVKALPDKSKPADFNGAVGHFTLSASLDKPQLSTDDAGTLKVTIRGSGNITLLNAPKIDFPTDFDTYDPKVSDQVNKNNNPFSGSRTFEYVFMPKHAGTYSIPAIRFAYFDPQKSAYDTTKSPAFTVTVSPGKNSVASGSNSDYSFLGNEIQPIRTDKIAWSKSGTPWFSSAWYWLLFVLPLIVLIAVLLLRKRNEKLQSDQVLLKNKRANKVARKRLSKAAKLLQKGDSKVFYEEVSNAVWGYLCDKLSIPFAELSRQKAEEKLAVKKVSADTTNHLFTLLDNCEMALYAGMSGHDKMRETYNQAAGLISLLEEQIK